MLRVAILSVALIGFSTFSYAEDCYEKGEMNMYAVAKVIKGPAGSYSKVEIVCGKEVIATCTAKVVAPANSATCNTHDTALEHGKYDCRVIASKAPAPTTSTGGCYASEEGIPR
jgi:hypothetical protein